MAGLNELLDSNILSEPNSEIVVSLVRQLSWTHILAGLMAERMFPFGSRCAKSPHPGPLPAVSRHDTFVQARQRTAASPPRRGGPKGRGGCRSGQPGQPTPPLTRHPSQEGNGGHGQQRRRRR